MIFLGTLFKPSRHPFNLRHVIVAN
jgi:hypothetical protein